MFNQVIVFVFALAVTASAVSLECRPSPRKPDKCSIESVGGDFSIQEVEITHPNAADVRKIEIENVHLGRVPKSLLQFKSLTRLELSGCHIFTLNDIKNFELVEDLSLEKNNISEVREGQLVSSHLEELDLGENAINVLDEGAFKDLTNLTQLDLSYNRIQELPKGIFSRNLATLQTVELQGNRLEDVEGIFSDFPGLLRIDLSDNKLTKIAASTFRNSPNIFKVKLVNNQIETVDPAAFESQKHVQSLYLSGNRLKSFEFNVVSSYLIHLSLARNQLETLSVTTELQDPRVLYFDAANNHLQEFVIQKAIPLKKIDVSHNNIKRFTANISKIEFLHLDNNNLQPETLEILLEARSLTFLTLNDTEIDETQFRRVVQLPKLKHLDVSYNYKLANVDFSQVSPVVPLLDTLEMNFCGIGAVNVDQLRAKFPNLRKFGLLGNPIKYKEVKKINNLLRNDAD